MAEPSDRQAGHETRDVNATAVGCFALAMVVGCAAVFSLIAVVFHRLDAHVPGGAANRITSERISAPAPELQIAPAQDMERFRAAEQETLTSYGWVDRQAGIARIPIERAMELIAERGLPAAPGASKTPLEMRQEKAKEAPR
jgi:hypothetical protein